MHDMTAKKAAVSPVGQHPHFQKYHRRFPTTAWLRQRAPRNVPLFAFEYGDTGAGNDVGIGHNWAAFDAVEIVPRYGVMPSLPPVDVKLFGRSYAAPIGVAPMGGPSLVWPGADLLMAKAAQRARIPYTLSVAGGATIEQAAEVAPDVFWLQLYRFWHDDHKIGFDLVRRGQAAGAKVLALTLDVPVRTTRSRETYAGLAHEFRPNARMIWEMMVRPKWMFALLRNGYPRFATISDYAPAGASTNEIIAYARARMGGAFSWEEVKRYRDAWKGPMAVKGILHPKDAEKAVALGIDGIWVSNHGGRQIEGLIPSIDVLPAIVAAVGKKATVILDSGVRSGQDVMRALALGANAAFAGKSFLWA
ncbi:MAG: alpha-hydroxy acid oxidase, partial [Pseudolabrys sp.]